MIPSIKCPNQMLLILLLAPFCKPVGVDYYPLLDDLFLVWKMAALLYLAVALLPKCLTGRIKKATFLQSAILVFWMIYFAGCIRAGADVVTVGTAAVSCIFLLLLISYQIRRGNGMILLQAMSKLFIVCIAAHVVSVFAVRAGMIRFADTADVYLFGYDNYSAFFLYPMLAIALFYRVLRDGRIGAVGWGLMLLVVLAYLYTASMTAAGAGLVMIGLFVLRRYWGTLRSIMDTKWILAAMVVFLVLVCVFSIQNLLASLLNAMEKGVTLNSRTYIWEYTLRLIRQKPLLGHGSFTAEQINSFILYGTTHAHNLLLELLLRTGIVGAAAYIVFLCGFVSRGKRKKLVRSEAGVLVIGLVAQLVLSFMDFYPNILVFYIFMGIFIIGKDWCRRSI